MSFDRTGFELHRDVSDVNYSTDINGNPAEDRGDSVHLRYYDTTNGHVYELALTDNAGLGVSDSPMIRQLFDRDITYRVFIEPVP